MRGKDRRFPCFGVFDAGAEADTPLGHLGKPKSHPAELHVVGIDQASRTDAAAAAADMFHAFEHVDRYATGAIASPSTTTCTCDAATTTTDW